MLKRNRTGRVKQLHLERAASREKAKIIRANQSPPSQKPPNSNMSSLAKAYKSEASKMVTRKNDPPKRLACLHSLDRNDRKTE
jgi:hypothetical protein